MMITLLMAINPASLVLVYALLMGKTLPTSNESKFIFVFVTIFLLAANYRYFANANGHSKLVEHYESKQYFENRNGIAIGFLVFGSLALLFLAWFVTLMLSSPN